MTQYESAPAARYDAGPEVSPGEWLRLHRNENLFLAKNPLVTTAPEQYPVSNVFYPDENSSALRITLAAHYRVSTENIFVGNGSDEVLAILLQYLRKRFDALYIWKIGYAIYPVLGRRFQFMVHRIDDLDGSLLSAHHDSLFLLDSPNAITGERSDRELMISLAQRPDCFLIWDNCYGEFCDDAAIGVPLPANIIFVRTFSKFFGLAGLRVGYCLGAREIISDLMELKDVFNVNAVAQQFALRALCHREEFERCAAVMRSYRDQLVVLLRELGFLIRPPHGNFVFASHPMIEAKWILERLRDNRVQVRWYSNNPLTVNWLRITVPPPQQFESFSDIIRQIIETSMR
jgi:histidinol-phosphate aminotransferase